MAIVKRIGWILVGVVIGGGVSATLGAVRASQEAPPRRLAVLPVAGGVEGGTSYFIKDTRTGACWLTIRSRDDISAALAPAPPASCEQ
jgi:hypothetical protein